MNKAQQHFEELAGRIEGLAQAFAVLVAVLETPTHLDGERLEQAIATHADYLSVRAASPTPKQQATERTMREVETMLTGYRTFRLRARKGQNQSHQ